MIFQPHPYNPLNLISKILVQTKQNRRQPFLAYLGLVNDEALLLHIEAAASLYKGGAARSWHPHLRS
jgi:hypothetical protein